MNQITDRLFIGDWHAARDNAQKFYVVTIHNDQTGFSGDERFDLVDGPGNDPDVFWQAAKAVAAAVRTQSKPVLVHCVGGRSRSVAVTVAALAELNGWNHCQSYDYVISKRDVARIHPAISKLFFS